MRKITFLLLIILGQLAVPGYADLYQWRDAQGKAHFSDKKPANETVTVKQTQKHSFEPIVIDIQVQGDGVGEGLLSRENIEQHIRAQLAFYQQHLNIRPRKTVAVNLHIFAKRNDFSRFIYSQINESPGNAVGMFIPATNTAAAYLQEDENQLFSTILHEVSHVIFNQITSYSPMWINEGLAEYMENMRLVDGRPVFNPSPHGERYIKQWIAQQKLITLKEYLGIPNQQWRDMAHSSDPVPYTVAWSLTYFLMSSASGKNLLKTLLKDMEFGQYDNVVAIDKLYPGGVVLLEYEWFDWAQKPLLAHRY